ncbi:MAG TPA: MraY family glycosyltransferase [Bacteroidales bacterium]|nr:MraY family glycosyltransferase [Bacteroidales bacterium]
MSEIIITGWPAIFLAFVSSLVITWFYIPKVIKVVYKKHLADKPGNRKIHKRTTPTLGGIGIFAGFIFGFLIGVNGYMHSVSYFMAAVMILFFVGLKDDLIGMNPWKKFGAEVATALIITLCTDLHFTSFHGFLGMDAVPAWLSILTTVFIIVLVINAVNLIDGIDGLASAVGIIASLFFGTWFFLSGDYGYTVMAAALLGSLIVFIFYNVSNGRMKIFMGDTGSIVIGFTLVIMAIRFNELDAMGRSFHNLVSTPSVSIAVLIVPLFDTLRVIYLRFKNHQNVFRADNRHVHHLMLRMGFSHKRATLYMSLFNIFIIALALLLDGIGIFWLGVVLLVICWMTTTILIHLIRKKEKKAQMSIVAAECSGPNLTLIRAPEEATLQQAQ